MKTKISVLLLAGLVSINAYTQNSKWVIYDNSNSGLPVNSIEDIVIDTNGIIWMGTWGGGLVKYDGANWTVLDPSNSGLPDYNARSLAVDDSNYIWVGTTSGLARYNGGASFTVFNMGNSSLPNNNVRSIAIDKYDTLWVGTGNGLAKFDGNSNWTIYMPGNAIRARTAFDTSGNKWIGTQSGLLKFDDTTWTLYDTSNSGLVAQNIRSIAVDDSNNIWVGTATGGLAKFNGVTWAIYDTSNSGIPLGGVYAITIDVSNNMWLGTSAGMARYDGTNWAVYDNLNSPLPANYVGRISIDANHNKWLATSGGIAIYKPFGLSISKNVTCNGGSDGQAYVVSPDFGDAPYTYLWDDSIQQLSDTAFSLMAGTYHVTVTDSNGFTAIDSVTITEPASLLTATAFGSNPTVIGGSDGNVAVTAGGGIPPYSYLWNDSSTQTTISGLPAGTYTVTVTDSNGCSVSDSVTLTDPVAGIINGQFSKSISFYPNPVSSKVTFVVNLPASDFGSLKIYNLQGFEVATVVENRKIPEKFTIQFDVNDLSGGIYVYQLRIQDFVVTKKMVVVK